MSPGRLGHTNSLELSRSRSLLPDFLGLHLPCVKWRTPDQDRASDLSRLHGLHPLSGAPFSVMTMTRTVVLTPQKTAYTSLFSQGSPSLNPSSPAFAHSLAIYALPLQGNPNATLLASLVLACLTFLSYSTPPDSSSPSLKI